MYSLTKIVPRFNRLVVRGLYSDVQASKQIPELPAYLFGQTNISDKGVSTVMEQDLVSVEGFQGEIRDLSVPEARHVLSQATEYEIQGPSVQIAPEQVQLNYSIPSEKEHQPTVKAHSDVFEGLGSHVSLHGHMQSNVPYPHVPSDVSSGYGSFQNMPGGTARLLDKYVSAGAQACHPSRQFSTSSKNSVSQQGSQEKPFEATEILQDVSPQGIQGDNCVSFKLWMENCQRYHLPNCDEQLASLKSGRKSLAQVFKEQQDIIRLVAEDYKRKQKSQFKMAVETNAQGQQDYFGYAFSFSAHDPCPQGFQGDDCATYKAWAHNCMAFGFGDCAQKDKDIQSGRRTLQEVFNEQEELIKKIVANYVTSQALSDATSGTTGQVGKNAEIKTSSRDSDKTNDAVDTHSIPPNNNPNSESPNEKPLSNKDKLKRAVKEYGATVVVFHIGISLMSLGGFYMAVSSGLDVVGILTRLGISESIVQSRVAAGSTTFVVAYAVHKVFAPVRIATTLTCTPFIVRYLRRVGVLKPPKSSN